MKGEKQTMKYYNLETLVRQLIENRAGQHNSLAQLIDKNGKSQGKVIVDLQYNKESRHHLLQLIAPAEMDDKHRGMASYTSRFMIKMDIVDVDNLVKNIRTTASTLLQLVDYLTSNMYVDFSEIDKKQEELRKAEEERQLNQLANRARRESSRGVSG